MVSFKDLKLAPKVLSAIVETGYTTPTPIQAKAIPKAMEGKDVLGIAQTGTGKTASFTLPIVSLLSKGRARARMPRSLVLCPTRELAAQVAESPPTRAETPVCFPSHTQHGLAAQRGRWSTGRAADLVPRQAAVGALVPDTPVNTPRTT